MQNKPNFRKAKMNLNLYMTKDYENKSGLLTMAKQTQTNPIKPNLVRRSRFLRSFSEVEWRRRIQKPQSLSAGRPSPAGMDF